MTTTYLLLAVDSKTRIRVKMRERNTQGAWNEVVEE